MAILNKLEAYARTEKPDFTKLFPIQYPQLFMYSLQAAESRPHLGPALEKSGFIHYMIDQLNDAAEIGIIRRILGAIDEHLVDASRPIYGPPLFRTPGLLVIAHMTVETIGIAKRALSILVQIPVVVLMFTEPQEGDLMVYFERKDLEIKEEEHRECDFDDPMFEDPMFCRGMTMMDRMMMRDQMEGGDMWNLAPFGPPCIMDVWDMEAARAGGDRFGPMEHPDMLGPGERKEPELFPVEPLSAVFAGKKLTDGAVLFNILSHVLLSNVESIVRMASLALAGAKIPLAYFVPLLESLTGDNADPFGWALTHQVDGPNPQLVDFLFANLDPGSPRAGLILFIGRALIEKEPAF
jgi:hypothetical protein